MTDQAVQVIITVVVGQEKQEIHKDIPEVELESTIKNLSQEVGQAIFSLVLQILDDQMQKTIPKTWKNVGRVARKVTFESGYTIYKRRIYRDEHGQIWKPLDLLLGVEAYARNSRKVQEMGCLLASRSSYRNASEMLSYLLKTVISPSSLQRMVKRFGAYISACEADWRQVEPAGKIKAPILYAESDGVWLHLQQAKTKRAEVKVGLLYSGKRRIGSDRFCCENKVVMTQLGGSNEEWQIKLRELADRHFDLKQTNYLVVGGDGATWVKHSFDLLNLPQVPVLDRFHVARAVHSAFSKLTDSQLLLDALFSQPFETVKPQILELINQTKGKQAVVLKRTLDYLENNQHALLDLAHRLPSDLKLATLGCAEANVDKLVRQRMRGRGFSWSFDGGEAMLAVLRHKDSLSRIVFPKPKMDSKRGPATEKTPTSTYQPISASMPIFQSSEASKDWVQLLKIRMNRDLSLTELL
jgi:hypothetical protein